MTITAKVIADSISPQGIRLTTLQLRYPKFIHGEFMTHRVFSRNASSSRAIPVERLIKDVLDDPAMPIHWGKNQKGMQADEECVEKIYGIPLGLHKLISREEAWLSARSRAVDIAMEFSRAGYHKQIVNRLIEPFCHINVVVSATEWSNFFALRDHEGAQPEIRELARQIGKAMGESEISELKLGEWHLPYIVETHNLDWGDKTTTANAIKVSVARCARVSYLTQEGREPSVGDDLALYEKLVGAVPLHASPAEHQATPDAQWADGETWARLALHGNFKGWVQYRKTLLGECQ